MVSIMGKSKLAPKLAHIISCLEVCAAVLAIEMADVIMEETDVEFQATKFYTDSKIMRGDIHNTTCLQQGHTKPPGPGFEANLIYSCNPGPM